MFFVYIIITGVSGLLIYFSAKKIRTAKQIQKFGITADAVVTKINTRYIKTSSFDNVTLEYTDANTKKSYTAIKSTIPHKHKVGDMVPLRYHPANPAKYAFNGGKIYWATLILSILLMLFMLIAAYKINEMIL